MKKIIVVVGPTASGKTALSVRLAKRLKGEVISADSRQVYRGLDIGSGKVTKKEMAGVPHHLLDIASPKKVFSADDFVKLARRAHSNILKNDKMTIIAGGTGFYIDALMGRVSLAEVPANVELRKKLRGKTAAELLAMLEKKDPMRAAGMNESDSQNPVRLIRALEVAQMGKKGVRGVKGKGGNLEEISDTYAPTEGRGKRKEAQPLEAIWIGIKPDKEILRKKIHDRLLARMKMGMVKEVERLHADGVSWKRLEELGLEYRYLAMYLQKKITKEEMLAQLETKIVQYSVRQMTYWGRNKEIRWFPSADEAYGFVVGAH